MEKITRINGNGQPYTLPMPKIFIVTSHAWNETALKHIKENTGLDFVFVGWGMEAQPTTAAQITALILTYNFKTRYYDNADYHNTLMLKSDHHIGFDVDAICPTCAQENNIRTDIKGNKRLAC